MREYEGVPQARQVGYALVINADYDGLAAVQSVSVEGPLQVTGPGETEARQRIFSCRPSPSLPEHRCAATILSALARKAFRRPVNDADIRTLMAFYDLGREEGHFDEGIEMALRRLLADPQFLYRREAEPADVATGAPYRISDLDLASRLSFFLWSSIPDDELLTLAERGQLREPTVLERQVRRMLADPRSEALATRFAAQWLRLHDVDSILPDAILYPYFDRTLGNAFVRETALFFDSIAPKKGEPTSPFNSSALRSAVSGSTSAFTASKLRASASKCWGFEASFSHPFGVGIGKTSMAASKAGKEGINTENDVASVFAALGLAGGVLYAAFIVLALFTLIRLYLRERTAMHLAWVGMGIGHITQWWSGTLYATTSILFLVLGGAAAASVRPPTKEPARSGGEG